MFVVADIVANETVELATHVAPCASQLERSDLNTSSEILQLACFFGSTPRRSSALNTTVAPCGGSWASSARLAWASTCCQQD